MKLKRILSLLIALTMIFSCVGLSAMAETVNSLDELLNAIENGATEITLGSDIDLNEKSYVAKIGDTTYETLSAALSAVKEGETITLLAGTYEMGSVKFPATLKNVTIKGAENKGTVLKNSLLYSSDGNSVVYEGITFDGIVFDNSQIVFTGARNGEVIYKNWTITNCEFSNIVSTGNAAVHFNLASDETFENLTFTNNVINGVSGGNYSGLRANYLSGNIIITGNNISNVAWNAVQLVNADTVAFTVEENVFASSADEGILNLYNVTATDLNIAENQFLVKDGQAGIGYLTSGDVSKNYWGGSAPANLPEGVTYSSYYTTNDNGVLGGLVELKQEGLPGSGTEEDPYKIGSKDELTYFAMKVNDGTYKGVYAELTADIDLEQDDWTSIGTSSNPFTGVFDGKGFEIQNIWSYDRGLFGYTSTGNYVDSGKNGRATIKNLTINGVEVYNQSTSDVGGLIGQAGQNTELSGVTVTGYIQVWGNGYVGGIVGQGYVHVDDCHVKGINNDEGDISEINAAYWAVGGIVGHAGSEGGTSITNCSVENVKIYSTYYGAGSIAGVGTKGKIENVSAVNVSIEAQSSPDANGYLVGCNYDKVTGNSTATNVVLKVAGEEYHGVDMVAKIGDTSYVSLDEALTAANAMTGDVTVEIYDKVTLSKNLSGSFSSINFVGKTENAEIYMEVQGYIEAVGKSVSFADLKLSKSEGGYIGNAGFMNTAFGVYNADAVSYTNCTFVNGAYASKGVNTFTGCTFKRSYDKYGLWAYGDVDVIVDGCTFADYRGIKMYAEGAAKTVNLTVKNSDFSAVDNKPAIVLTYGESVTLENNTYSSTGVFELDLDGAPDGTPVSSDVYPTCVNDNGACGVLVDGKIYTTVAQTAEVAVAGSNVVLLHESTEVVEFPVGVILDRNGTTSAGVTVAGYAIEVILKDGTSEYYNDMAQAVRDDQISYLEGATIKLLKDYTGKGMRFMKPGMVLDLNGFTYTVNSGEGSNNSKTSCFQVKADSGNTLSIVKNGTIKIAPKEERGTNPNIYWVFNSYTGLDIENVTIDCTNLDDYEGGLYSFVIYTGDGKTTNLTGTTSIINYTNGGYSIANRGATSVTNIDTTGKIEGLLDTDGNTVVKNGLFTNNVSEFCEDGYATVKNADGLYFVAKAPNAEVTVLEPLTLEADSYMIWPSGDDSISRPLEIVMNFKTNETTEEARPNGFLDWKVDFYLEFEGLTNKTITADNCYLAGNYGEYGWIVIPTDELVLEEGIEYPVVSGYDANITYKQICDDVKDFTAAIHVDQAILDANPNFKVKLSLKMTNPNDANDVLTIGEPAVYTAEDLKNKEEPYIFGTPFYMIDLPEVDNQYQVNLYSGINSLNYREVGFRVYDKNDNLLGQNSTDTVYTSIKGANMTIRAEEYNMFRIFGANVFFGKAWDNVEIFFRPYAIDLNNKEIVGKKYPIADIYTLKTIESGETNE